jgi:glycosyl hydrolase family 28
MTIIKNRIVLLLLLGNLLPFKNQAAETLNPFAPPNFPGQKFPDKTFDVKDFGATGDGIVNDTPAINQAIAKCNADGGGTVLFPAGSYAAGSIHLKSNVRLLLDANAVIFGLAGAFEAAEPNPFGKFQDGGHSHFHDALMWGENLENVAIVGGKINGGGAIGHGDPKPGNGDKVISIKVGKNLDFENITHEKGGHFVYLLNDCENVTLNGVVIKESRDAVDLMGCRDVQIHNCNFTGCGDDTIGVKSDYALGRKINSANIYVWDSYFESGCNGLQFGSETAGDFHNVNFWNIRIGRAMKAGIGLTSNDGGVIDDVNYSNIVVSGAASPIYMIITDRLRSGDPDKKTGTIKNVHIMNVTVTGCLAGRQGPVLTATISGRPKSSLENITLENVQINYPGGGDAQDADIVPPYPKDYSPKSLGPRPASGLYVRHVKGLTLRNVEFTFDHEDQRPPIIANDVDGLTLDGLKTQKTAGVETMRLENVKHLSVKNSPGLADQKTETIAKAKE